MAAAGDFIKPIVNLIRQRPVLAVIEVTLRCNSACGYCDLPLNVGRYEMSRAEIKRLGLQLYGEGIRFLLIQGGEPLVRKDLLGVLEDLAEIGFAMTLVTNGTRLKPAVVGKLAELGISVSISLDSLDRDRYRKIRGADQLPMVLSGLKRLENFPHRKFITCIVSDVNRNDVADVVKFANERGFTPVVGAYHWGVDRYGKEDEQLQYKKAHASAVFEHLLERNLVAPGYFRQYLRDNVTWLAAGKLEKCDAGRYSIAIDASDNVAPCLALPHTGNVRFEPLPVITERFDRGKIDACSDASSCNMMCSRVIGSLVRHPARLAVTVLNSAR